MDHDRLFKELLTAFFAEFVEAFLPQVAQFMEPASIQFLDKEVFTDITAGEKHEVDLIVQARFRGQETFFLIHVENQSTAQTDFPRRMFRYFARLSEKHDLPVYPVVIFSYDAPRRAEPDHYTVAFPGETATLAFRYKVIQLNRLSWRVFARQPNPAATALMTKMKMSARDRPRVKLECLRLLASLKLDPARATLIGVFIESYLQLSAQERKQYERAFAQLLPEERKDTMELMTSWERQGRTEGISQGKETLVLRQLRRRLGAVSAETTARLDELSADQLDDLGEALLDFGSVTDLEQWLAHA